MNRAEIKKTITDSKLLNIDDANLNEKLDAFITRILASDLKIASIQAGYDGEVNGMDESYNRSFLIFEIKKKNASSSPIKNHRSSVFMSYRLGEFSTLIPEFENISFMLNRNIDKKLDFVVAHLQDYLAENYLYRAALDYASGGAAFSSQSLYGCLQRYFNGNTLQSLSIKAMIVNRYESGAVSHKDDQFITLHTNDECEDEFVLCELNPQQKIIVDFLADQYEIKQKVA